MYTMLRVEPYTLQVSCFSRGGGAAAKKGHLRRRDYTPVSWDAYYDTKEDVTISEGNVS